MLNDISLNEAIDLTLTNITSTNLTQNIFIYDSLNEVLAEDIIATRNSPVFTNSAMDGFAFKHSSNKKLKIIGEIFAGDKYKDFEIKEDECVKIMTGARVPDSLDTVIPIEKCLKITDEYIEIPEIKKGANVRIKGEEYKKGEVLIKKGTIITPQVIAGLVSQGIVNINVFKKPSIAILSTGNELKEPWERADEEEIYNINSHSIKMLLKKHGFEAEIFGIIPDKLEKAVEFIKNLKKFDVIITSGGISFGEKDFMYEAFKQNGLKEFFHGIRLKPGRPTMVGKMDESYVFALPGNPLSSYLNALVLLIPALKKLNGTNEYYHLTIKAKNKTPFKLNPKKSHTVLGKYKEGYFEAYKNYKYGSGMVSALFNSNAVAIINEEKSDIKDEEVEIILI
ncbi:molybdopterin molybdotransferase MoeA [Caminibacter sp.]